MKLEPALVALQSMGSTPIVEDHAELEGPAVVTERYAELKEPIVVAEKQAELDGNAVITEKQEELKGPADLAEKHPNLKTTPTINVKQVESETPTVIDRKQMGSSGSTIVSVKTETPVIVNGSCHSSCGEDSLSTILQIQKLHIANRRGEKTHTVGLWDAGSTLCFITFKLAQRLRLQGDPVMLDIVTVGGVSSKVNSQRFVIWIIDSGGELVEMEVLGIEQISTDIETVDTSGLMQEFKSREAKHIARPVNGNIDLLIGFQYAAYHPVPLETIGHLMLMKNRFGVILAGSHPQFHERTRQTVKHAVVLHASIQPEDFYNIESLGVSCVPSCGGCKCGKCHPGGKNMTIREEKELQMIEEGLQFDERSGRWQAKYPWVKDPGVLPENRHVAFATLKSTEKRLERNPLHAETYKRQMNDMLERKVERSVSDEELREYNGPRFYISHHDVLKPESHSTAMRIVFNSSARIKGISLNECLAKGPSLLNNILGILLRFRQEEFAFIGDISKMFHSISIPIEDQMTHLFLWRNLQSELKPNTYAMTAVNMGDRPAAAIAQTALRKTAEEDKQEFPEAAKIIVTNSYMDDIPGSLKMMV